MVFSRITGYLAKETLGSTECLRPRPDIGTSRMLPSFLLAPSQSRIGGSTLLDVGWYPELFIMRRTVPVSFTLRPSHVRSLREVCERYAIRTNFWNYEYFRWGLFSNRLQFLAFSDMSFITVRWRLKLSVCLLSCTLWTFSPTLAIDGGWSKVLHN
jgi:hypothetical protein